MVSRTEAAKAMEAMLDGTDDAEEVPTARQNAMNRQMVVEDWSLGPEKTSVDPKANRQYWRKMARLWDVDEAEARRRFCSNCEYYDNRPSTLADCEQIPLDQFDMDGGGRGYCVRFDFVCHSLRTCQAWEEKSFDAPDEED